MRGRIRLAAYAFSVRDGSILLTRISDRGEESGRWTLPGGGLEWGESPEEGMHRELYEETGLRGSITGVLGVDSLVLPEGEPAGPEPVKSVRIVYRVDCEGEPRVTEVGGTVDAARWVPLDGIHDYPLVGVVEFALEEAGPS